MNDLIKICYENDHPTVLGRDLHKFLEIETPYTQWFDRMLGYGFSENADFIGFSQKSDKPQGGRPMQDHQITIDMAKELCMIQRTERGKQARLYFLDLEKAWNTPEQVMARALKLADQKIKEARNQVVNLEKVVEEQRPQVLFAESVAASDTSILIGNLAKLIRQNGVDIGQNRLFEWLREEDYLCSRKGDMYNAPTQRSMDMGLFEMRERTVNNADGSIRITRTTLVTGKGQIYFVNKFCG